MSCDEDHIRLAVAEQNIGNLPALRLGRALRFALFDVSGKHARGPFYRVRHLNPGEECDHNAELSSLLHDCQLVITGSVGVRLKQRLLDQGVKVISTPERIITTQLIARYLNGMLEETCSLQDSTKPPSISSCDKKLQVVKDSSLPKPQR